MTEQVVELSAVLKEDAARVGTKAAHLGDLLQAGFNVPDGFVVVITGDDGLNLTETRAVSVAWEKLNARTVAVRSSSYAEDLDGASFAGQYESILSVETEEALSTAIEKVRASNYSERVQVYAGISASRIEGIPVLVQRQVDAEFAGVAFSANPVTGNRSEVVIDAVVGMGDRAVGGEVTPQQWVIRGEGTPQVADERSGIDATQAREIAALARQVESHFGSPQDIEWAIADGEIHLLQARPVTSLPEFVEPVPVAVEIPAGFWQRDSGHAPQPNTPLYSSMVLPHANTAGEVWFEEYGFLLDGMEWKEIGGWQYVGLVPLGGKTRKPPPPVLMPVLRRLIPSLRSRVTAGVEAIRADRAGRNLERWHNEWREDLQARASGLRSVQLSEITDAELATHVASVSTLIGAAMRIHFVLHGAGFLYIHQLVRACRELLDWDDSAALDLLSGLSGTSTEPAAKLSELAREAIAHPGLAEALVRVPAPTIDEIAELAPDFGVGLQQYLDEYGYRALRYEIVDPTFRETPELVVRILGDQVRSGFDPEENLVALREHAASRLDDARGLLAGSDRDRFEQALTRATLAYPVREDSEFLTVSVPLGLARLAALELGSRLADRGQIADKRDVFYLEYQQALGLLGTDAGAHSDVIRRRGERAWALAHPGPGSYGRDPGPPPSLDGFPIEVRTSMTTLLWAVERTFETELSSRMQSDANRIEGLAASPGTYTGTARLVMDETEFDRIRAGDVLVCPITSPVWSVLFPMVGALVTDTGGILSHPAIIAREYRIPAVAATGNATSLIEDGCRVTVDGTTGVVEIG